MTISATQVKELREITGLGIMDCKSALSETNGDLENAAELLRKKGMSDATKRNARTTAEGRIGSYLHTNGKIGVMVEVNCETDFVAKNEDFQIFIKDLCMHICAFSPDVVAREEVDAGVVEKEKEIYSEQVKGKPDHVMAKIVEGKLNKYFQSVCLLEQAWVKDDKRAVKDILSDLITMIGEHIVIKRFSRMEVGG